MKPALLSFAYCFEYLRDQVADVAPADMVAKPKPIYNHPAWVLGHLTYSCQALGGEIGVAEWLPPTWRERFGTGSVPMPDLTRYESKETALRMLCEAESRVVNAVNGLSDIQLDEPLPDERLRDVLPTVRHAIVQVLVAHTATHIGQLTVWRQAMNLPRLSRPFF